MACSQEHILRLKAVRIIAINIHRTHYSLVTKTNEMYSMATDEITGSMSGMQTAEYVQLFTITTKNQTLGFIIFY